MTGLQITNEDDRRKLTAFPEAKMLEIKDDCVVGGHYHKLKTEYFILTYGECEMSIDNYTVKMELGKLYKIFPFEHHTFNIRAGSVLIGLCSHPYDPKDDYHD